MSEASASDRAGPGPARLPGTEGFYVLTPDGGLGRHDADGQFVREPGLSNALAARNQALLRRYRAGEIEEIALGLVTADIPGRPWHCASLVFSDHALREVYPSSNDDKTPLTDFQKSNRIKSLFQGMELVLDARKASQPQYPRYCPVMFEPEVNGAALAARYGLETVASDRVLEVLDLMAPLDREERQDLAYSNMVMEMVRTRIAPDMRSSPELRLAAGASPAIEGGPGSPEARGVQSPWPDESGQRHVSFRDGDPVPYWLLAWFAPFNHLNDLQREFIARTVKISKRPAGVILIERGSREDISYFLVEGTVLLKSFDGRDIHITGGTKRAQLPVSQLNPHAYTVQADTEVTVIPVSQSMLRKVTRITTTYENRSGIEVREQGPLPDTMPDPSGMR